MHTLIEKTAEAPASREHSAAELGRQVELPVRAAHAAMVRNLPDIHRDPFDRLLIAQALSEPLRLTSDGHLAAYSNLVITV